MEALGVKKVTRSVMAAEIQPLIYGINHIFTLRHMLEEISGIKIPIEGYVDSKTLFDFVAKFAATLEKRLQIDVFSIRESLNNKELQSISWILDNLNPSDPLTKFKISKDSQLCKITKQTKLIYSL